MADEPKTADERNDADAGEKLDKILAHMDGLTKRMDAMERDDSTRRDAAKKDGDGEQIEKTEPKEVAADKRKDGDETDEEKAAKADKARKDAEDKAEEERKADAAKKDEDDADKKAMADSLKSVADRIADVEKALPRNRSEVDRIALVDAQARADKVFHAYGDSAPRPLDGEDLAGYRRRMVGVLKERTTKWKAINAGLISDAATFDNVEAEVYADAMASANSQANLQPGTLREVKRSEGGHTYTEYHGDPSTWMNPMAGANRRFVTGGLEPSAR